MIQNNETTPLPDTSSARPSTRSGDFQQTTDSMSDTVGSSYWDNEITSSIATGTFIGLAVGGVLGMVNGTLAVMISPFFLPGFDYLVSQPLETAVMGASLGVIFGALIGSLLGWSISCKKIQELEIDLESNASFCPIPQTLKDDKQRIEAWKEQHGEYANI